MSILWRCTAYGRPDNHVEVTPDLSTSGAHLTKTAPAGLMARGIGAPGISSLHVGSSPARLLVGRRKAAANPHPSWETVTMVAVPQTVDPVEFLRVALPVAARMIHPAIDRQPLTPRQLKVYTYLDVYIEANGYAPSVEEIGEYFELTSTATVAEHLANLVEKGWITRRYGEVRSIRVRRHPQATAERVHELDAAALATETLREMGYGAQDGPEHIGRIVPRVMASITEKAAEVGS